MMDHVRNRYLNSHSKPIDENPALGPPGLSQPKRLIDALAPSGPKWVVDIHGGPLDMAYLFNEEVWNRRLKKQKKREYYVRDYIVSGSLIVQSIDQKPESLFDYTIDECKADHRLIVSLAKYLSHKSADYFCRKINSSPEIPEDFVTVFFKLFYLFYLPRCCDWYAVQLLLFARKFRPVPFKHLMDSLFQNIQVPNKVLQNYAANIGDEQCNNIMLALLELELTPEEFIHHLGTINVIFLHSTKSTRIVQHVFQLLENNIYFCYTNKDYGRLFLSLLNNMGNAQLSHGMIKKLIDKHGSVYKAPCLVAFDDLLREIAAQQYQLRDIPRFPVYRPVDENLRTP